MAKYTMHDYENEMREEARQTQLQEALETKLESESFGAEDNWREWQEHQRIAELESQFSHDDDWFDYDWFDEHDFDDLFGEEDYYLDLNCEDEVELCLAMCETEEDLEMLRISRKAIARNRHLGAERAKRKAEQSARILERRYLNLDANATPYEEYRAYARATRAAKKAERVKTA